MRWRKVAMKEAEKGSDPAQREFETTALPPFIIDVIHRQIARADSIRVGLVFDTVNATLQDMEFV